MEAFARGPGGEGGNVEFKDLDKISTPGGRKDVAKLISAFANNPEGGVLILGVGKREGSVYFQTFSPDSEVTRDLINKVRSSTRPPIDYLVSFLPEELPGGRLLRIEVRPSETLVQFKEGKGLWAAYIRAGDTTVRATPEDLLRWARRKAPVREPSLKAWAEVDLKGRARKRVSLPQPMNRFRVQATENHHLVFGWIIPFMPYQKAVFYRLESLYPIESPAELAETLRAAETLLGVPLDGDLGYSIQVGNRIHGGLTAKHLLEDCQELDKIAEELTRGAKIEEPEPRRVAITLYAPFTYGIFWAQMDWRPEKGRALHGGCGVYLQDLPFDPGPLQKFFMATERTPGVYQQTAGAQIMGLKAKPGGKIRLHNVRGIPLNRFGREYDWVPDVIADNPFFGRSKEIQQSFDEPIPEWLADALCSAEQLPFFTQAGIGYEDGAEYYLQHVELMYASMAEGAYFVNCLCWRE